MICWYGDKITPSIKAVYKISGFDYNIPLGSQAVFKRYNRATRRFNRVTPSNRGNYKHHLLDNQRKTDRAGVSGQTQSEVPGGNSGSSNAITSDNAQKTSYNIAPNGRSSKDDTIFDDFADEVIFTADGDIAFDGFGADAQRTIDVKEMVQEQGAEHAVYTLYNAALEMVFEVAAVSVSIK